MVHDLVLGFTDRNSSGFVVLFFEGKIRFTNVVLKHFYKTWFGVGPLLVYILGSKFVGSDNLGSTLPYQDYACVQSAHTPTLQY